MTYAVCDSQVESQIGYHYILAKSGHGNRIEPVMEKYMASHHKLNKYSEAQTSEHRLHRHLLSASPRHQHELIEQREIFSNTLFRDSE